MNNYLKVSISFPRKCYGFNTKWVTNTYDHVRLTHTQRKNNELPILYSLESCGVEPF